MEMRKSTPILPGVWTLPLAGLLWIGTILLRGPVPDPSGDATTFARTVASTSYLAAWLGIIAALVLVFFGIFALYAHFADGARRLALAAMVLSVAGAGLVLPLFGIFGFAYPALGEAYLEGQTGVVDVAAGFFGGPLILLYATVSGLLYSTGFIAFGVAIWRSRILPKWSAVPFALSAPLLAFPLTFTLEVLGAVLLAVSGTVIALGVRRQTSAAPVLDPPTREAAAKG
jgi:hypothetical protein